MRFADINGNQEAVEAVRGMVDSGRIPHALLLSGPPGIGKMLLARALVSYINCENPIDGDSCGVCPSCRRIEAGNNPDIHYIYPIYKVKSAHLERSSDYAKEWTQMLHESPYMDMTYWMKLMNGANSQPRIYVDDAAEITSIASLSSYSDNYKIFLIWLPERLQPDAANKILKILEEPQSDTLFIAVSDEPNAILPTIYSRMRRIEMKRPSAQEIEKFLLECGTSPSYAPALASLSEGSLLKATQLIGAESETQEFGEIFRGIMRESYARKVAVLKRRSDELAALGREKSIRLLDYFGRMTRENFISNLCLPPLNVMTPEESGFSSKFAPFINVANVEYILSAIDDAKRDISRNGNSKLIWFDFMILLMISLRKKPQT
ncbi:MAG: DNA polymerase III subunit delta' [Muribaculaceae bacterium]|nr:DNA polymerase III subunit delta' [Muribaculaceae bacterium]